MIEKITSQSNIRVKRLTALRRKARERREEQAFILEGERLFADAPRDMIREIYMTEDSESDNLYESLNLENKSGVIIFENFGILFSSNTGAFLC